MCYSEILDSDIYDTTSPCTDCEAWDIIRTFATSEMTLPNAEEGLKTYLGDRYNERDWQPALDAVMNAEGDIACTQEAIHHLASESQLPWLTIKISQ